MADRLLEWAKGSAEISPAAPVVLMSSPTPETLDQFNDEDLFGPSRSSN